MLGPDATATYGIPSNVYVIGDAFHVWLVGTLHSGAPVAASAVINAPPSSPNITSPLAVVSVPPHERPGPGCGSVHRIAPVWMSIAFRIRRGSGSRAVRCEPPRYDLPDCQSPASAFL